LAVDISDIYLDLNHDLHDIEERGYNPDSLWELRFSFRSHWENTF